jgi:hypothetical protein
MALVKAVMIGAIGALAVPYVMRDGTGQVADWARYGLVQLHLEGFHFAWSWPIFCIVTLFAWAMLAWADR